MKNYRLVKLMHLITGLDTGGAEIMLYRLLSHMDHSRFESSVVSMTDSGDLGGKIETLGIPVFTLGMRRGVPNPLGLWRLLGLLRKERPLVLQTWLYHADLLGSIAGKLAGVPSIIWNVQCSDMDMQHYSWISAQIIRVLATLTPVPQAIVVNSERGRRWHEKVGYNPRRWVLVPNGFDLTQFRPDSEARKRFRQKLDLSDKDILIGLIARYDPMKDHDNFLIAASFLLKDYRHVHFVLVGHGVDNGNETIVMTINEFGNEQRFHLLGWRDDIPRIMPALDIVTSSSLSEGFSNIIGEAMACGVPCVVTDVGDSAVLVGDTGKVVPPKNPAALANAWRQMIELGDAGRTQLGMAARHRIEQEFSLPAIVARYEGLYQQSVANVRIRRI